MSNKCQIKIKCQIRITFSLRKSLSYRNQSIDLHSKSIHWLIYDRGLRHGSVKHAESTLVHKNSNKSELKKTHKLLLDA